jgi:hypothetical protein
MSAKRYLTHDGRTASLQEWADTIGISKEALMQRLIGGWTVAEAVTTPRYNRATKTKRRVLARVISESPSQTHAKPVAASVAFLPFEELKRQHLALQRQFNSTLRQFNRDLHAIMSRSLDRGGVVVDLSENANDRSTPITRDCA